MEQSNYDIHNNAAMRRLAGKYSLRKLILVAWLVIFSSKLAECKIYTQPYRLRELFYREETIITILETALTQDPKMPVVEDYLNRFEGRRKEVGILTDYSNEVMGQKTKEERHLDKIMEHLVGNPIHVYSLIYRLVKHLHEARQELANHPVLGGLERAIYTIIRQGEYPGELDMEGVALSLSRVQFTYRLDPLDLAKGKILGVATSAGLTTMEMLDIATRRITGTTPIRPGVYKEYALAYEWTEAALSTIPPAADENDPNKNLTEAVVDFLEKIRQEHDLRFSPMSMNPGNLPNEEFFIAKIAEHLEQAPEGKVINKIGRELREVEYDVLATQKKNTKTSIPGSYNLHDFYALCRGDRNPEMEPDQKCYLTNLDEPRFTISPLKMEVLALNPPVAVFHEILSGKDISSMKHFVSGQLNAAEIQDVTKSNGAGSRVTTERTQSSGWLWDHQFPFLYKLSNVLEKITKLKLARPTNTPISAIVESEAWQIGVYGPGGHYLPHYDAFDILDPSARTPDGIWVGNRMSTVMFYLSNVVGGATAFPKLGVAARPRAGSMVYWHNLRQSGEREMLSLHGACPTALGIKWVSNKWIREGAQIFQRPCATSKDL